MYNIDPDAGRYCSVRRQLELEHCFHIKDISGYYYLIARISHEGLQGLEKVSKKLSSK